MSPIPALPSTARSETSWTRLFRTYARALFVFSQLAASFAMQARQGHATSAIYVKIKRADQRERHKQNNEDELPAPPIRSSPAVFPRQLCLLLVHVTCNLHQSNSALSPRTWSIWPELHNSNELLSWDIGGGIKKREASGAEGQWTHRDLTTR